ncbi:nucleotidyltransferase domain-containing protein [Clostridium sp. CF012]|uniref:nucleotidyltransferase domain-containing protein n=1 Tax=Clostridium sp. CF012 TaxID=2843319 RepID=UPI001C0AAEAA|nr:nucleotidyltransferase domain-containing protein [Clostridium sp. CF012]MBU3146689.1 nucleotidyltransferase domain-containing protein [Clostridium sp. CF012]
MNLENGIANQIVDISKKHKYIDKIILFSSRARGDNSLKSDIDLVVYSNNSIAEFKDEIEESVSTLLEFDFSHMNNIEDKLFIEQVEKEGVIIYEKS